MKKLIFYVCLLSGANMVFATSQTIQSSIHVDNYCTFLIRDIGFSDAPKNTMLNSISAPADFYMNCWLPEATTISLDNGLNANGNQKRMIDGTGQSFLSYQICLDSACATPVSQFDQLLGQNQYLTLRLYGKVTDVSQVSVFSQHTDSVLVTITYSSGTIPNRGAV